MARSDPVGSVQQAQLERPGVGQVVEARLPSTDQGRRTVAGDIEQANVQIGAPAIRTDRADQRERDRRASGRP